MKKEFSLAFCLFILFILCACAPEKGDAGAMGPKGDSGAQGAQGSAGTDAVLPAYSIVNIIDPCGNHPSIVDEVLLILANGQVLVSFSENANGKNTRFSILPPGTYATTDGSGCVFTLNADGTVQ